MSDLTHIDAAGNAVMVDVSDKPATARTATARGALSLSPAAKTALADGTVKKGDPLAVAQLAGIMAAKKTADLIPLCHPLALSKVSVECEVVGDRVEVSATVKTTGPTGVEMEALTAVSVACLTLYDMLKAVDKGLCLGPIELQAKSGGNSGDFTR